MNAPQLLTADEVAELLRCDRSTVHRMVKRGVLPRIVLSAKTVRFNADAIRRFMETGSAAIPSPTLAGG